MTQTLTLNRALILEHRVRSADGAGGWNESWERRGVLWAAMAPRSGRTTNDVATEVSRQKWRIFVRAAPVGAPSRPGTGERFREGARIFRILTVYETDGDARYLTCQVEEEAAL